MAYIGERHSEGVEVFVAPVLTLGAAVGLLFAGRLSQAERVRRSALRMVTGVSGLTSASATLLTPPSNREAIGWHGAPRAHVAVCWRIR